MQTKRYALSAALLASTTLVPVAAFAQDAQTTSEPEDVIEVRFQYIPDDRRVTSEVSAGLSIDDLETTGDDDLAAALVRVTGLSTTQGRFVVVRGLNERYSNTLLNGSPMPSPEPFRRAAPLDILPTNVLSSVLVQKTFSPRFPGEFGGGVIGIETATLPDDRFLTVSVGGSFDTVTTGNRGITYDGSDTDWLGYDDGLRDLPSPMAAIFETTRIGNNLPAEQQQEIGRSLVNSELWVVQNLDTDANGEFSVEAGNRFDFDNFSFGILGAFSYANEWETREGQRGKGAIGAGGELGYENGPPSEDRSGLAPVGEGIDNYFGTENRIDVSGMVSLGVDFYNDHSINLLSMVLRSTSKEARIQEEFNAGSSGVFRNDSTEWFERQVIFNQLSGEHVFESLGDLAVDWRVSDATANRDAPYQRRARYAFGVDHYQYDATTNGNSTSFSEIEDNTSDYGVDFALPVQLGSFDLELTAGYSMTSRERDAWSRRFSFTPGSQGVPADLLDSRIDYIFAAQNITDERLRLIETGGLTLPEAYRGELDVEAWYAGADIALTDFVRAAIGARFEDGEQSVDTFAFPANPADTGAVETQIQEDYVLPAVTLTWTFADNLQLRTGYSQSIARPQFRELAFAEFFNTDTDQRFLGNPFLVNTEIESYDARLEYYFGRDQFVTVGAFHKILENPIEEYIVPIGDGLNTSFINAPEAELTGAEFEFEKVFDLSSRWDRPFFNDREWFIKTNYTYIQSEVSADGTVTIAQGAFGQPQAIVLDAAGFVDDGRALQGQSEHLFNVQLGFETFDGRARGAILYNYTGERSRAVANLSDNLPEIVEQVPSSLDLVYSRTLDLGGNDWDFGFSIRNILGDDYEATQNAGGVELPVDTYEVGTSFSVSVSRSW
ncbi:TonB-dependent receptor domain-containing protein [Maricaulis virginensis]|uniref:TonB-dependent receptor n=1 Tax=Maricaulis virginensis TaxID=144022 RepID=A0A9W6INR9_9PROT|nr:TonB-dependent receptor [Maricaulis virginensis]GLK52909.1 TonB-dependent receptor [Maricaulis virginensis]